MSSIIPQPARPVKSGLALDLDLLAAHLTRAAQRAAGLTEIPAEYLDYLRGGTDA